MREMLIVIRSECEGSVLVVGKAVRCRPGNRFFTPYHHPVSRLFHKEFLLPFRMTIGGKGVIMRGTLIVIQGASEESAAVVRKEAGEMLYFSLLYLYGTNDDWRKGCHNEGNVNRHPECEGSITVMRESVSIGSSFVIEAISACEYLQSHRVRQLLIRRA